MSRSFANVILVIAIIHCLGVQGKEGEENISVKASKAEGMHFTTLSGNETEQMFRNVDKDEMNITMQNANISMQGYVSEEVKQ